MDQSCQIVLASAQGYKCRAGGLNLDYNVNSAPWSCAFCWCWRKNQTNGRQVPLPTSNLSSNFFLIFYVLYKLVLYYRGPLQREKKQYLKSTDLGVQ